MIEVLIALVVLAVGLLGLGLMQTMNLRYTKSAQQRTQAVNLAGALLDTIRANRSQAAVYAMVQADFTEVSVPAQGCGTAASMSAAANIQHWQCKVKEALGPTGWATVDVSALPAISVTVGWSEDGLDDLLGAGRTELVTTL